MKIKSINPSNNQLIGEFEETTKEQILSLIDEAHKAQLTWGGLSLEERCKKVLSLSNLFVKYKNELAEAMSVEMGQPLANCLDQVDESVRYFESYVKLAPSFFEPEVVFEDDTQQHIQVRESLGVIVAISPWNFPIHNVPFQLGQALIARNCIIYKPSEEIPMFTKLLEKIVAESDLPRGVLSLVIGGRDIGEFMVSQPNINLVLFTGSSFAGNKITAEAAKNSVPVLTEMGGSAPGIIFEDADLDKILNFAADMRFNNTGQYCDGLKRLIVHESLHDRVIEGLKNYAKIKKVGDPSDSNTDFGPLVAERQVVKLKAQVQDALDKGAKIIAGGKQPECLNGAFYEITVLDNISFDMKVWREEVFGPVLPVVTFKTEEEAIKLANDTEYGLGAFIFTEDYDKYLRVASKIQAGNVAHNTAVYFSPLTPFGGYKNSGHGRSQGIAGFEEVTQIKVITKEK